MLDEARTYFRENHKALLDDYFAFLRFPSISADPTKKEALQQCADWLFQQLEEMGLAVEQWKGGGAPVLFAEKGLSESRETLLFYCHYDVQPVDPLSEWTSPPFEPEIRDGAVYARGASDNKGQCFYTLAAIRAFLERYKKFPVNFKFLIEGEEESGSAALSQLLKEKEERLRADHLVVIDSGIDEVNTPTIAIGARGITAFSVKLSEAKHDLHSGIAGGIAYNPNRALCELLAKLHDHTGSVAIPGFYDEIVEMMPKEREELDLDFDAVGFEHLYGFPPSGMEAGLSPLEANWLRPTLEINGISGGYAGDGFKTVIPASASAKISCRLVPFQKPERISSLVIDFLHEHTPPHMHLDVEVMNGSARGFRENPKTRIVELSAQSYSDVFQKGCKKTLVGGSVPITAELKEAAKAETVLIGVALPSDRVHAPDEHFSLECLEKGFLTIYRLLELFQH